MVPGHHQLRSGQPTQERDDRAILPGPGALREVAADDQEVRPKGLQFAGQRLDDAGIGAVKVQVGNLGDAGRHG